MIQWFQALPPAIQVGSVIAVVSFLILFSSIIWERVEDRSKEENLLDDNLGENVDYSDD